MLKKVFVMVLTVSLFVGIVGCTELNLDELVGVPVLNSMLGAATSGIHSAISTQLNDKFGENPVPSAVASGLSATADSLVDYVINRTIGDRIPK